jgi:phosphoglycerate dehydrogenase-like enzyme
VREALPAGWTLATPDGGDFAPHLRVCDFILVADHPVTARHIAAAPRLKMIQHQGVGYERIDLEACRVRGIPVALTPEGTSVGVAEHTVLLILALYQRLLTAAGGVHRGEWHQWDLRGSSFELCGKTVGLVGYGRIGRAVGRRVRAFDARVRTFDPLLATGAALDPPVDRAPSLPDLLASADIVSLHLPMRAETRHLIGREALAQMKRGAVLVNTRAAGSSMRPPSSRRCRMAGWPAPRSTCSSRSRPPSAIRCWRSSRSW